MKYPHQLSSQTTRSERRYGSGGVGPPRGVVTERPGGALAPEEFVQLVNIDWMGNAVIPRPGQDRLHGDDVIHAATAHIHPHDFRIGSATRLWHCGAGCPGIPGAEGFFIGHYDQEQVPLVQRAAWYPEATLNNIAIGTFGAQPYVSVDDQLRRLQMILVPYGTEQLDLAGQGADLAVATYPGFACTVMIEYDGYLFLALRSTTGGTHKIVTYDGKTVRDDLPGIAAANTPVAFGLYRDDLILGYVAAAGKISRRVPGNSPGTWTDIAGSATAYPGRNSITSYKDKAYIASGGTTIASYDGTTLATAHTIALATITSVEEAFGYLFYGFNTKVGRYDNTTWIDAHKILAADEPAILFVDALRYYRDSLAAGVRRFELQSAIMQSPGQNTAGTWEVLSLNEGLGLVESNLLQYLLVL